MAGSQTPIQKLFDLYSDNLALYVPDLKGYFCCPLCLDVFGRGSLPASNRDGDLSIEHIIPRSIGGNIITLTCRKCNNKLGTELDAHIVAKFNAEDGFAGKRIEPLKGRVSIGHGEMAVDVHWGQDSVEMRGVSKASNPARITALERELNLASDGSEIHLNIPLGYRALNSQVAILKMAYLLMFRQFGYGYILHPNSSQVREQIDDHKTDRIVSKALVRLTSCPPEYAAVNVLSAPKELRCFFVTFNLSSGVDRFVGVIMPGLDESEKNIYERWQEFAPQGIVSYQCKHVPYGDKALRTQKGFPAFLWGELT